MAETMLIHEFFSLSESPYETSPDVPALHEKCLERSMTTQNMNDFFDEKKYLGHPWADLHETLRVYRVDPEIFNRHIFDFRS